MSTRRTGVLRTSLGMQTIGLALYVAALLALGQWRPLTWDLLPYAVVLALLGTSSLALLYRAFALGPIAVELVDRTMIDLGRDIAMFRAIIDRMLIGEPARDTVSYWQAQTALALDDILTRIEPAQLCIENIERWSPEYFAGLVVEKGLARCVDVGHLWLQGRDPLPHLRQNLERTRVIHIHGVGGPSGRDHQSLARQPRNEVFRVLDLLAEEDFKGVLTLEVFGLDDFVSSRQVIEEWENNSH